MTYSGSLILEKKIFKWPNPIFVIIPPFEEDLDFHLNKCKICLYQVWLKLALRFILKDYFQYTKFNVKIGSPLVSPNLTLNDHNLYKLKSALYQKAFM